MTLTAQGLLSGKVIAVTGGASGTGRGIALRAAAHGAKAVIIGDLSNTPKEGGETTQDLITAAGGTAVFQRCDIRDTEDLTTLFAAANAFGGLDVMVCNAGIALPTDGPEITHADFARLVAINLAGTLKTAQTAAEAMVAGGSIVVISSMGGLRGAAYTTGYSMTKAGVNAMTQGLADAYGPKGIRVNAICPGLIDTLLIKAPPRLRPPPRPCASASRSAALANLPRSAMSPHGSARITRAL